MLFAPAESRKEIFRRFTLSSPFEAFQTLCLCRGWFYVRAPYVCVFGESDYLVLFESTYTLFIMQK